MSEQIVVTSKLSKEYVRDEFHVAALDAVDLVIDKGDFVALMGPSGSGKSTLLHLIAAMDKPTDGEIRVLDANLRDMSDKEIAHWRNIHIGFIFQSFNLIPVLTALENVELPLKLTKLNKKERFEHAETALKLVGLGDRFKHLPKQLSGGQEQRVAMDAAAAEDVLTMLTRLNREFGKTIVMVTHDPHAAKFAKTIRHLEKGQLLPLGTLPADWAAAMAGR